jgi:response regulator RpfG family c-di-GMP phosphodiesterase
MDGLTFCRQLKEDPVTADIGVVLLTGSEGTTEEEASACQADALLRKPFSPLELLNAVERIAGGLYEGPFRSESDPPEEQLILYAQDLRRLLEVERGQRALIQRAYQETVMALASALESKDTGTGAHSLRVQRYAIELASSIDPALLDDESTEYGFLLHDVGKIGIPDSILLKPGRLTEVEMQIMRRHTLIGADLLANSTSEIIEDARVVALTHHERWDGGGYPHGLAGERIPIQGRLVALADALDALTHERPYKRAVPFEEAAERLVAEAGSAFDPNVVEALKLTAFRIRDVLMDPTPNGPPPPP